MYNVCRAATAMAELQLESRRERIEDPSQNETRKIFLVQTTEKCTMPIVFDTGCSYSVTPFKDDFVDKLQTPKSWSMLGIKEQIDVEAEGWIEWTIRDYEGQVAVIRTRAYYIPEANTRLYCPQQYMDENRIQNGPQIASCSFNCDSLTHTLADGTELHFPFARGNNLPLMMLDKDVCEPDLSSQAVYTLTSSAREARDRLEDLLSNRNYNISNAQKELLLWHFRLGHAGMSWIQELMKSKKNEIGTEKEPPVLPTKHPATSKCEAPRCAACQFSKQFRRTPDSTITHAIQDKELAIRKGDLHPGDCVSTDQYVCKQPGRLSHTYGKEDESLKYNGGTIYMDHGSRYVYLRNQISLAIGETLQGKHDFEGFAKTHGVKIKNIRADNKPFGSKEFLLDLKLQDQEITFSGVGAHHENGVAERTLRTISSWARAMLMHQCLHWPSQFNVNLWPFAMEHAVYLWNNIPQMSHGLTPEEVFTGCKTPNHDALLQARVWGCPVYVLDPKLQDGKHLPKFTRRSRQGMYVGKSAQHSTLIGRILNLDSGAVSPQYHVIYDEKFSTVGGRLEDPLTTTEWNNMLLLQGLARDPELIEGHPDYPAEIFQDFLDSITEDDSGSSVPEGEIHPISEPTSDPEGVPPAPEGASTPPISQDTSDATIRPKSKPKPKPPTVIRRSTRTTRNPQYANTQPSGRALVLQHNLEQHYMYHAGGIPSRKIRAGSLEMAYIQGLKWTNNVQDARSNAAQRVLVSMQQSQDPITRLQEDWHPLALAVKANDPDTPTWHEAMNGPFKEGFIEAIHAEINTLEDMNVWEVVDREPWMSVIPTTFAFRIKRLPSGTVKKLKARFCIRGDQEIKDVHYWETFAPVVSWTTVRMLLILIAELKLESRQIDYTAAFVHADVDTPPGYENMTPEQQYRSSQFAEMPRGLQEPGKVLRLKKNLYGKKAAPRLWFHHLKERLERIGFRQMIDVDPCLFISDSCLLISYVDDCILVSRRTSDLDEVITRLRDDEKMTLEVEDDAAGFLGVHIKQHPNGIIELTQIGLIDRIVTALGCDDMAPVPTPATECIGKDVDGDPAEGSFSMSSVVGMLQYLYRQSRPDIGFALSQCARFVWCARRSHELALIRIGRYLKGTRTKGLCLKPTDFAGQFRMDVYVDSDFLGLCGKEPRTDPDSVKSRGGHVILINGCPIIWQSKLIDGICLSTMMAEYYALSIAMREVLPLRELVRTMAIGLQLEGTVHTDFKVTVWEDNNGALTLANLDPGQQTPRSRHFDSKLHWFRSHLTRDSEAQAPNSILVLKISTEKQLADLFTKPLPREIFEKLRLMLLGW